MKPSIKFWIGVMALILLMACNRKTPPQLNDQEPPELTITMEEKIDLLAKEAFGEGYIIEPNKSKTVFLVSKSIRPRSKSPYVTVHFFLYETDGEAIIHRDVALRAEVRWISDEEVKITSVPGQIEDPDKKSANNGYFYNVVKRTKRMF